MVAVVGEVDASNAGLVFEYVANNLSGCGQLVLDLSKLGFFGTEGVLALHKINTECLQRGVPWLLVAGAHTSRVLDICDPDSVLPKADSAPTALATLKKSRHLHLLQCSVRNSCET